MSDIDCTITDPRPLRAAITGDAMSCTSGMIEMTRGETAELDLYFTTGDDDEAEALDLTGAEITFVVKARVGDPGDPRRITKTSTPAAGITIAADQTVGSATRGHATLALVAADTESRMTPGLYVFEVRILEASGNAKNAISGQYRLKGEAVGPVPA